MKFRSTLTALAVVLACTSTVQSRRNIQQVLGDSSSVDAPYYTYYDDYQDYGSGECSSAVDIVAALNQTDSLTYFVQAAENSGALDILADPTVGGTVFVPNDAAFEDAATAMNMSLAELLESPVMLPILLYHVVPITFLTSELLGESVLPTLLGQELIINPDLSASADPLFANSSVPANITATESTATIIDADECNCDACTTAVNVIDAVLLPQILSVQQNGSKVLITLSDGSGEPTQNFLIEYETLSPQASPSASPSKASPVISGSGSSSSGSGSATAAAPASSLPSLGGGSLRGTYNTNADPSN